MSDPTPPIKSKHHDYYSWTSSYRDEQGRSHSKRWGRVGKVTRAQAIAKWRRWLETEYPKLKQHQDAPPAKYPVSQLCRDWYAVQNQSYHIDGKPTTTIVRMRIAIESFAALYGNEEADAMTAGKVALWLEKFASERLSGKGAKTKGSVNLGLSYIKRMFKFGATYKGVAAGAAGAVVLVSNMRSDSNKIRRKERIQSVAISDFEATCRIASPTVRAMISLMWWTGARPGEVRAMRPCDIDTSRDVWVYTPARHKNTWRGKQRFIAIGPKARAILEPILPKKLDDYVFTLATGKPLNTQGFAWRVESACRRAKVPVWHPNMLRHSFATRVRQSISPSALQDLLGHATLNQQMTYVDETVKRAVELAREVG